MGRVAMLARSWIEDHAAAVLAVLFLAAVFPILGSIGTYHGDEHFYTDSSMEMLRRGDYLTPVYPDGALRFKKPILTYWAVAAGFKLFGVGVFGSRIFSAMAGCGVVWLTFRVALAMFGQRTAAVPAALVMMSNIHLFNAAVRATPDVFQCLFLTLSLYGFVSIIFEGRRTWWAYACAYLGAGLAVEAKGLPGFLPPVFALAFCAARRPGGVRARDLVHWPFLGAGAIVGLAWFAAVLARHGMASVAGFLDDQVGDKVVGATGQLAENAFQYTVGILRLFLPWSAVLAVLAFRSPDATRQAFRECREPIVFALAWYVALALIFALGNLTRPRYLLPAYPLLAAVSGALLVRLADAGSVRFLRILFRALAALGVAAGLALAVFGAGLDWRLGVGGAALVCLGAWLWLRSGANSPTAFFAPMAALSLVTLLVAHLAIRPVFETTPAPGAAEAILRQKVLPREVVAYRMRPAYAGQLRLLLGGRVPVRSAAEPAELGLQPGACVVFSDADRAGIEALFSRIEPAGFVYSRMRTKELKRWLRSHEGRAGLARFRQPYLIAFAGE